MSDIKSINTQIKKLKEKRQENKLAISELNKDQETINSKIKTLQSKIDGITKREL